MINPTQNPLFIGLRAFIMSVLPGIEVVQGLTNLVPMPIGGFICITPTAQRRLSTNVSTYTIPPVGVGTRDVMQATEYSIQMDCYGPDASDYATTLSTMLRDYYGCDFLAPYNCQPFYTSDPTQVPLINGEENYEQRWMITAVIQFNPVVTVSQEFADVLKSSIVLANAETP